MVLVWCSNVQLHDEEVCVHAALKAVHAAAACSIYIEVYKKISGVPVSAGNPCSYKYYVCSNDKKPKPQQGSDTNSDDACPEFKRCHLCRQLTTCDAVSHLMTASAYTNSFKIGPLTLSPCLAAIRCCSSRSFSITLGLS